MPNSLKSLAIFLLLLKNFLIFSNNYYSTELLFGNCQAYHNFSETIVKTQLHSIIPPLFLLGLIHLNLFEWRRNGGFKCFG